MAALAKRRQRLETGDRQQPGGDPGTAFELSGGAPHVQEYLAGQVFGHGGVAHDPKHEAVNPHAMARIENVHRVPAAIGNALQQHFVGGNLGSDNALPGGGIDGDDVVHDWLPAPLERPCWGELLLSRRFRTSARQAENGFVRRRIVSSRRPQ